VIFGSCVASSMPTGIEAPSKSEPSPTCVSPTSFTRDRCARRSSPTRARPARHGGHGARSSCIRLVALSDPGLRLQSLRRGRALSCASAAPGEIVVEVLVQVVDLRETPPLAEPLIISSVRFGDGPRWRGTRNATRGAGKTLLERGPERLVGDVRDVPPSPQGGELRTTSRPNAVRPPCVAGLPDSRPSWWAPSG